jgi:hypothetical protein
MTLEIITQNLQRFALLEVEARQPLKMISDRRMKWSMRMRYRRRNRRYTPYGREQSTIALRLSQYGVMRAYWEKQAKRFIRNSKPNCHV